MMTISFFIILNAASISYKTSKRKKIAQQRYYFCVYYLYGTVYLADEYKHDSSWIQIFTIFSLQNLLYTCNLIVPPLPSSWLTALRNHSINTITATTMTTYYSGSVYRRHLSTREIECAVYTIEFIRNFLLAVYRRQNHDGYWRRHTVHIIYWLLFKRFRRRTIFFFVTFIAVLYNPLLLGIYILSITRVHSIDQTSNHRSTRDTTL